MSHLSFLTLVLGFLVTLRTSTQVFQLSTINYGYLISSQPQIKKNELNKLKYALESIGFFILTNHFINHTLMDLAWNHSLLFFNSSIENKNSVLMTKDYIYGYNNKEILSNSNNNNTNKNKNNTNYDLKETFQIMLGSKLSNETFEVKYPLYPKKLKNSWYNYYYECENIINTLLSSIAVILELNENYFVNYTNNHRSALRSVNYYPFQIKNISNKNTLYRCSEHSDWGTLTLLRQDIIGGLQIKYKNNKWIDIISDYYDFIVNIGDLFMRWTNNKFISTKHRVSIQNNKNIYLNNKQRHSMAFFHLINPNAIVKTFDSCLDKNGKSNYKSIKAMDYLINKFKSTQI